MAGLRGRRHSARSAASLFHCLAEPIRGAITNPLSYSHLRSLAGAWLSGRVSRHTNRNAHPPARRRATLRPATPTVCPLRRLELAQEIVHIARSAPCGSSATLLPVAALKGEFICVAKNKQIIASSPHDSFPSLFPPSTYLQRDQDIDRVVTVSADATGIPRDPFFIFLGEFYCNVGEFCWNIF